MAGVTTEIVTCVEDYQQSLKALSVCHLPDVCYCIICRLQPPSLRDLASHVVFINVEHFELTVDTTFHQYVYAVKSKRVNFQKLLPPEYPPSKSGSVSTPSHTNSTAIVPV